MDLVVYAGSEGEAGAAVRGRFRRSLIRLSLLTFGYRLAAPTTRSSRSSPRKGGEGMRVGLAPE